MLKVQEIRDHKIKKGGSIPRQNFEGNMQFLFLYNLQKSLVNV